MLKPKPLSKGDTIAIISPSAGLASLVPHRLDNAINFLKSRGFKVKEFPTTRKNNGWESAPAKERAKDIMDAFEDKEVKAIICSIGGNNINKVLKYIDFIKIKENPKIFCGYSDITVLHLAILKKTSLSTFYGPCAMTQFGEYPLPLSHTISYFEKAALSNNPIGEVISSEKWTEELLDWFEKKDLLRARELKNNKGHEWIRSGKAKGEIIGGCLPSILHLAGTEYWPDFKNKILFIETPEGQDFRVGMPLSEVDACLGDLENIGVFREIKGLIVGRPLRADIETTKRFKEILLEITKDYSFPILFGADIGHTDPQITIPLGSLVEIDSKNNLFKIY